MRRRRSGVGMKVAEEEWRWGPDGGQGDGKPAGELGDGENGSHGGRRRDGWGR